MYIGLHGKYIGLHGKYPFFLSDVNELNFPCRFSRKKSPGISNFLKICTVVAELFHVVGQTDMTKLIVAFRSFENARVKWKGLMSVDGDILGWY
jgi:hypothetical protein